MFILAHFLAALAQILDLLFGLYFWILVLRAILSWVRPDPYHPLMRFLYAITEPILAPLRRLLPPGLGIDLSPAIALLVLYFLRSFLVRTLFDLAGRLR
ncbi:MAG: YggT family protein [candidate division NC10 bacterium]|nr:YggT family protein [candidate division NC10 bacterium]